MTTQYTAAFGSPDLPAAVGDAALIRETVEAAGMWLSSYIRGNGTVDVRIDFDATIPTMTGGSFSAAMAGWKMAQDGTHHALATFSTADEILAGTDANGADPDAVITIGLTNLNRWYWFDPTLATAADIPLDRNDGFRIMLHELLHAVGFNGWLANTEDTYAGTAISPFDSLVLRAGGRSWFMGEQAQAAFGGPVPLTDVHLGDAASLEAGQLTGEQTLMSHDYVPNGHRLSLDPVVIAILRDLGFDVRDTQAAYTGTAANGHAVTLDTAWSGHALARTLDLTWLVAQGGSDYAWLLQDVDRLYFTDAAVALDVGAGQVAGAAYRLYQAAFDRAPDAAGLGYWIHQMDNGRSLADVAAGFLGSAEFTTLYGAAPAADAFVASLYDNVLHRAPDAAGATWWVDGLREAGDTLAARAAVLAAFAESAENVAQVAGTIVNGFDYTVYG